MIENYLKTNDDEQQEKFFKFVMEQLNLAFKPKQQRRYSIALLIMSYNNNNFIGQHSETRKSKTNKNSVHIIFKLCDWGAAKGQLCLCVRTATQKATTHVNKKEVQHLENIY